MAGAIKKTPPMPSTTTGKKETTTQEGTVKISTVTPPLSPSTTTTTTEETKPQQKQSPSSSSSSSPQPGLFQTTRWGCKVQTYPTSLAPKSLTMIHRKATCRCQGREEVIVKDYILRWVSYRIDELKEHPVKAATWARASCEYLGIPGALDGILDRIERLFVGEDGF